MQELKNTGAGRRISSLSCQFLATRAESRQNLLQEKEKKPVQTGHFPHLQEQFSRKIVYDSDLYCLGSNPSSAAQKSPEAGAFFIFDFV